MRHIEGYRHQVASHCETGSVRNLLNHGGLDVSEPMVFGVGSGLMFIYIFFAKGPSGFPLIGLRNRPGLVVKTLGKSCGIDLAAEKHRSVSAAIDRASELLEQGVPVAVSIDMFYMRYLPVFLHVHTPAHFVILVGREGDRFAVSDPYHETIAELELADLEAAWDTNAPLALDNYLCYVRSVPEAPDWKDTARRAIVRTCKKMLLPPGIRRLFPFFGVLGMRLYAKKMLQWPRQYRGPMLREGIMYNAVGFEDQGTGGGAFRLMYGAFLHEVADLYGSEEVAGLAAQMVRHGQDWRRLSRRLIATGKRVPLDEDAFDGWYRENGENLDADLAEISKQFEEKAAFEERFFKELWKAADALG